MHEYTANIRNLALTATTVRTILQVTAPATRKLEIVSFGVSFDGVTAANEPVDVDLLRQTTAGTSTSGTPLRLDEGDPASLATLGHSHTVEPSAGDILLPTQVTPNGGLLVYYFDRDDRPVVAISGRIGLRCLADDAVNVTGWITWRE